MFEKANEWNEIDSKRTPEGEILNIFKLANINKNEKLGAILQIKKV